MMEVLKEDGDKNLSWGHKTLAALSHLVSIVFHPIFLISYFFVFLYTINPYIFAVQTDKDLGIVIIYVVIISIIFPAIPLVMMYFLGLSESIQLKERSERTIPLALTGIFYLWLYINMLNNSAIPMMYSSFLLGSTITLFGCFFINLFTKISLHAAGIGGFMTAVFIAVNYFSYEYSHISLLVTINLQIKSILFSILAIAIAGMVGTARLILGAHKSEDLYGGYLLGIISQIIAMRVLLF